MKMIHQLWQTLAAGTRPLDWISLSVEVLVLGAILYFEIPHALERRRNARVRRVLSPLLKKGLSLQSATPDPTYDGDSAWEWCQEVQRWTKDTQDTLASFGSHAVTAFMLITNLGKADREVRRENGSVVHVSGYFGDIYQQLQVRIMNLSNIIENPSAIID